MPSPTINARVSLTLKLSFPLWTFVRRRVFFLIQSFTRTRSNADTKKVPKLKLVEALLVPCDEPSGPLRSRLCIVTRQRPFYRRLPMNGNNGETKQHRCALNACLGRTVNTCAHHKANRITLVAVEGCSISSLICTRVDQFRSLLNGFLGIFDSS